MLRLSLFAAIVFAATAVSPEPFDSFRDCDVCPEMIELPLGEFVMGQRSGEIRRTMHFAETGLRPATPGYPVTKEDEGPLHRVVIDFPFSIGRNEVTIAEWMACVEDGGCGGFVPSTVVGVRYELSPTHPVLNINYSDVLSYIAWINKKVGTDAYRLPTEAEWEYAARAGTTTRFAQGEDLTTEQANFSGLATARFTSTDRPDLLTRRAPVAVDELDAANSWGLRHMSGNVAEFTASCYTERYAEWATASEWVEKSLWDESCNPAIRGGAYIWPMDTLRSAFRTHFRNYNFRGQIAGFRVVREIRN